MAMVEATLKKFNVMPVGIVLMLVGALAFMVGMMLTPNQPYGGYEGLGVTQPMWNPEVLLGLRQSPKVSPLVPVGFDIAILGCVIALFGAVATKLTGSRTTA